MAAAGAVPVIRRYLSLPVTAALAAVAGLAFHRVFGFGPVLPVVAAAALVPTLLSAALSGPRREGRCWPLWISLVLTVAAWAGTAAVTVLRPALADGTFPHALREGVLGSWKSILTTLLPAPAEPRLLVLVHVLVWLAAFGSAELALRTSLRAAPCLPALAVFGIALLLGVDGPGSNLPPAAAAVVLIAVLVLVRSPSPGSAAWRPLLLGVPAAAVLGALALLAGPYVPVGADPYDPREQVQAPPPQQRDGVSPLDRVGGWLLTPDQVLFTVKASRRENMRLAVLDRFDGVTWSSTARFVPTGSRVPRPPEGDGAGAAKRRTAVQEITVRDLPGVWAPAADRPRRVDGLGVVVDPASGTLAVARELRKGQTYRVTSEIRELTAGDLAAARVATDAEARAATRLPWGPGATRAPVQLAEFRRFAEGATDGASSPVQRAAMLAVHLKSYARYDVTAPPGHSYRQLDYFLSEGRRGTPEHFAASYAVLARSLGLPTRVMVGFSGGRAAGDVRDMRAGDVMVWPEVKFEGLGWVPFNPTPQQASRSKQSDSVAAGETQQKLEQLQKNAASQQRGTGAGKTPQAPAATPAREESPLPWWVYAASAAGLLAAAYVAAVLLAPALRRRRRRRAGTPAARIAGAWRQTLDHLGDLGLATARTLTAHEVARFGTGRLGERAMRHLGPLADLVNHTRYAPGPPHPNAAERAWEHTDELGRLVTAEAGRLRRLRRRLHPRSLRRDRP
ncbi:transglutaminaseTgpA domain-containing protein [Spirillospora sp. NPDC029432]|uniref:transglutaminaseTgpA domain-containing protein n=1 Tax=Spirillospora sp. NPDC029432 TaxID=3154599 RepID=UPI0034560124